MISIGIEEKNAGNDLQEDCSKRKNYCKHNLGWQLQQPFYVDEPRWVDVDIDYIDSPLRSNDPYILTRGKKIYRIKNPEEVVKTIENYEALDYPSKNQKLLIKSRVRRTAKTNEKSQNKTADIKNNQIKERNYSLQDINNTAIIEVENKGEKSYKISEEAEKPEDTSYVSIKKYEKDDRKNLAKKLLHGFQFTKQNQIANGITDFIEQKQKIPREDTPKDIENKKTAKIDQVERINNSKSHFAINLNDRNKKSILLENQNLSELRKKRELYEIDTNSKKDVEKNGTYEQMKIKAYVNKLNDRYTPDNLFTLSQDKNSFYNRIESSNKKDTDRNKFIEAAWKLHYAHRKKLDEINGAARNMEDRFASNKDGIGITDLQLTNEPNSRNSETKSSNHREKRTVCKSCKVTSQFQDEWLKNIEQEIQESLSLERRDKHRDILERLREPYIISRGKKDLEQDFFPSMSNSRYINDEDRAKMMRLPESLLRTLLMETSKCNNDNCNTNENWLSNELSPRDRRGTLDEIFAGYDPYYVARGKRTTRNQQDVPFETDARQ